MYLSFVLLAVTDQNCVDSSVYPLLEANVERISKGKWFSVLLHVGFKRSEKWQAERVCVCVFSK